MKKVLFAISFICYFAVTSGVIITSHFCMKRLVSVHLYANSPDQCGRCGMDTHESSGCCHDVVKVVKLEQDQNKIPVVTYGLPTLEIQAIAPSAFLVAAFENTDGQRHFHNHSPPLLSEQDTYLQNNVFRI
ncbi:MAG: hypothetical protein WAU29_00945 [Chitinophagaceae bacterium]|nr:hypothetical protein [Chitinophagaceae bacterium]